MGRKTYGNAFDQVWPLEVKRDMAGAVQDNDDRDLGDTSL